MTTTLLSLALGAILGYLAQRSRMCFIGGLRDYLLVRDTELLKGVVAFFVTAWLVFSIAGVLGAVDWRAPLYQGDALNGLVSPTPGAVPPGPSVAPTPVSASKASGLNWKLLVLVLAAGITLGLVSVLANGCPTRQHVLAAQGVQDSLYYLLGFYSGVVFYYLVTRPLLSWLI